ncbi:hypothetical protein AHMF7605_11445 [Adhaeribacter arboris]|uniref:Uncharacterized protein n=1 Tax=Adhaeribacter arboris TaxID=2072846 RepID=A0A2T2YEZ6_9BACT|nr:hypothetical protein [Adhaeribacter arboris]PSR54091.1 hypothetical protein AHMF7605_11445 [Adhaeribacter arboris]
MSIEELRKGYFLCDGEIISLNVNLDYSSYDSSTTKVALRVRKRITRKLSEPCIVELTFIKVQDLRLFEDFKSGRDYSDIVLKELESGQIYLSLDPFGNSGEPHEEDNLVIISKGILVEEKKKE